MLWQADKEVLLDMWRLRYGTRVVSWTELNKKGNGGCDWFYVCRLLAAAGHIVVVNNAANYYQSYQLKEGQRDT